MSKFFVENNKIKENIIIITGDDVNHIKNVLRKKSGDTIEVCNKESKRNYLAEINSFDRESIVCKVVQELEINSESNVFINVFQGLPKSDKMELIIQKSVELGASKITPVAMKRCVVKLSENDITKKVTRWQKIAEVASKQSERNIIPKIDSVTSVEGISKHIKNYDIVLVAYENEKKNKLKNELETVKNSSKTNYKIAIVIGPEGGLEPSEVETLRQNGAKVITLGNRILRTETVALNMISIINYELES